MEPIYTFIRDQGWVIQTCESFETTMLCGTKVHVERRVPKDGEVGIYHHKGQWNLDNWIYWFQKHSYTFIDKYNTTSDYDWVTVFRL